VCELVTSKNQIKRDKSTPTLQLVVASVLNNNASSFGGKSSSTFQLVVASVDWKPNAVSDKPFRTLRLDRIKNKMQSIYQLIALTFKRSIKVQPIFQLIDVFVANKNDSCSVFQMIEHGHNTFVESTSFNDSSIQLVVKSDFDVSRSEGARASSNKFNYFKISFHVCKDCRIFWEGEWEWDVKDDGKAVVKRQSANDNCNWDSCRSVKADTKAILETNALPFSGKSKTSFGCTSASTFRLVVAYFDLIPQADSTTEIFATAITLAEVIMKQ